VEKATTAVPTAEGGEDIRVASFVRLLARALPLAVAIAPVPAMAQDYPTRPVTIVVGYTPGATSDLLARTVAERLNAAWGQSVIVDNRSGVGGNIAAAYVARAPADGYTLMVGTDAIMTSNVFLYKNTPFDPVKDFAPITNAGANIICLAVHVDLPVNSVAELIAYAKAHPGQLQYGSSGIGSPHHLAGELLRQKTGIDIVHVPYRGGGATINDLLGGHIKVAFLSLSTAVPHLGSGKIKIVAVVEKARYAAMPDIPAVGETVAGFEMSSWVAFFAPAATPAPLVARLNEAMVKVLTTDAVKEKLATLGLAVAPSTPAELAAIIREGLAMRGELVKAANIQAE
jgi:tripartite-type tricarboxylate transporter receptor subunit TctC